MNSRLLVLAVALFLAVGSAQAGPARATPEAEQQARRSFARAEAHFQAGLFAEALTEYQEGYDLIALPGFLVNIAQCHRRLGDLKQARFTYRKFVLVAPDSKFVPEVKRLIAELDALLIEAEKSAPAPAEAPKIGQATSPAPAAAPASRAKVPRPPPIDEEALPTGAEDDETRDLSLVSVPVASTSSAETGPRWWLWGSGAAVVVAAVVAVLVLRDPGTNTLQSGSLGTLRR